jgi:hypothetical protein
MTRTIVIRRKSVSMELGIMLEVEGRRIGRIRNPNPSDRDLTRRIRRRMKPGQRMAGTLVGRERGPGRGARVSEEEGEAGVTVGIRLPGSDRVGELVGLEEQKVEMDQRAIATRKTLMGTETVLEWEGAVRERDWAKSRSRGRKSVRSSWSAFRTISA